MECPNCKDAIIDWDQMEPFICKGCGYEVDLKNRSRLSLALVVVMLGKIILMTLFQGWIEWSNVFVIIYFSAVLPAAIFYVIYRSSSPKLKAINIVKIQHEERLKNKEVIKNIQRYKDEQARLKASKKWWQFWL